MKREIETACQKGTCGAPKGMTVHFADGKMGYHATCAVKLLQSTPKIETTREFEALVEACDARDQSRMSLGWNQADENYKAELVKAKQALTRQGEGALAEAVALGRRYATIVESEDKQKYLKTIEEAEAALSAAQPREGAHTCPDCLIECFCEWGRNKKDFGICQHDCYPAQPSAVGDAARDILATLNHPESYTKEEKETAKENLSEALGGS